MLGIHIPTTDCNRIKLIAADAPVKKFLAACFRIKRPARANLYNRHSKRPVVFSNLENRATRILWLEGDVVLDLRLCGELLRDFTIACRLARMNDVIAVWTKNFGETHLVKFRRSFDKSIRCLFSSGECSAFALNRRLCDRTLRCQQTKNNCGKEIFRFVPFHKLLPPSATAPPEPPPTPPPPQARGPAATARTSTRSTEPSGPASKAATTP